MPGPSLGDAVIEVTADMSQFNRSLDAGLKAAKSGATKSGNDTGKALGDSISDGASSEIGKNKSQFAKAGASVGAALGDGTKTAAKSSLSGVAGVVSRVLAPIRTVAGKALSGLGRVFAPIGNAAAKVFGNVRTAAGKLTSGITTVFGKIGQVASKVFTPIGSVASKAFNGVKSAASAIAAPVQKVMNSTFGTKIKSVFGKIPGAAKSTVGKIGGAFSKIGAVVGKAFSGLASATGSVFSKVASVASAGMKKVVGVVSTVGKVGLAAAAATAGAALAKGFSRLTGIENAQAAMEGLGYSAKQAAATIQGPVLAAVKGTAFGLDEAAQAAQGALGAGVKQGEGLEKYLTLVGDAAAQAQIPFGDMAQIMNKVQGAGKLTGETLQQMTENGLPAMSILSDALGKPQAAIQQMVSDGEISAAQFQDILENKIGGSAQKMGNTTMGAFKNMGAALGRLGASFESGIFPKIKGVFASVTEILDKAAEPAEKLGKRMATALGPAIKAFQNFTKTVDIKSLFAGIDFGAISSALNPIMTIFKAAVPYLVTFGSVFKNVIADQMKNFGAMLASIDVQPLIDAFSMVGNAGVSLVQSLGKIDLSAIFTGLGKALGAIIAILPQVLPPIMQLVSVLSGTLGKILPVVAQGIADIAGALSGAFGGVLKAIMPSLIAFVEMISGTLARVLPIAAKLIGILAKALGGVLAQALPPLLDLITDLVQVLGDALAAILPPLIPVITMLSKALGTLLGGAFRSLSKHIMTIVTAVLPPLVDLFAALMPIITTLITNLLPPLVQIFNALLPIVTALLPVFTQLVTAIMPLLVAVLKLLMPLIIKFAQGLGWALGKFADLLTFVSGKVTDFIAFLASKAASVKKIFQPIVDAADWVYDKLFGHSVFPDMEKGFADFVKVVGTTLAKIVNAITKPFKDAAAWINTAFKKSWAKVSGILSSAVAHGGTAVGKIFGSIRGKFTDAKNWVGGAWRTSWSKVSGWISSAVGTGRDKTGNFLTGVRDRFTNLRRNIGGNWRKSWSNVSTWMSSAVGKGRDKIGTFLGGARTRFSNFKGWVGGAWRTGWNKASEWIAHPIRSARDLISRILGNKGVQKILRSFVTAAGQIMDKLKKVFGEPVQWVINNAIIPLATAASKIGSTVGIKIPIPAKMSTFASGGVAGIVPGYTPGRDTHIIGVGGGEAIMRPEITRAVGEPWVNAANAAARAGGVGGAKAFLARQQYGPYAGFASGGVYQPVPGRGNRHTSGYPWATWAGDYPVPTNTPVKAWKDGIVAMVKYLTTSYGRHVRINHEDGSSSLYAHLNTIAVKVGQKISGGQVIAKSDSTGNSTGPHLHFETMGKPYNGGSGSGSSVLSGIMDKISALKTLAKVNMPGKFGDNAWTKALIALPAKIGSAAFEKLRASASSLMDSATGMISDGAAWVGGKISGLDSAQKNNAATIISVAKKLGFGDRGAIIGLITALVESGLRNVNYGDRDSLGLFQQRAPWGSAADRTNPAKAASMFFLGGQGGQPGLKSKAWRSGSLGALAQAVQVSAFPGRYSLQIPRAKLILAAFGNRGGIGSGGKYDNGGWLPPGASTVINGTGRREPHAVFTQEQWGILSDIAKGRDRSPNSERPWEIHLHGVIDSESAGREIEKIMQKRHRAVAGVDLPSRSRRLVRSV